MSIIADEAFYDLDGPLVRITTPHMPAAGRRHSRRRHPADVDRIVDRVRKTLNS
jgi:pyruvate dehydrogenase E1 component beta subunit